MTTTLNGSSTHQARKSLANQIDRLDHMLDGLADGLNEAVADAVKVAVSTAAREAIQAALIEVLTNPEVLAKLNARSPAKRPAEPTVRDRFSQLCQNLRTALANIRKTVANGRHQLGTWAMGIWTSTVQKVAGLWQARRILANFKWQLATAAGVGATVAVVAWFAGPHLSAVLSGAGGFCTTLTVYGWLWLRKVFRIGVGQAV